MQSFLAAHQHIAAFLMLALRACIWLALMVAIFAPLEYYFRSPARQAIP